MKNEQQDDPPLARVWSDGSVHWIKNGRHHREDGPALIYIDRSQEWYRDGKLHREDGPAVTWAIDGSHEWWLNDIEYEPTEWLLKVYELTNEG